MSEPEQDAADTLVDIELDDEQLARLDELIEQHSTPLHRLTREELLLLLVEKGRELVEQGESLLPFLEATETEEDGAPGTVDGRGRPTEH